MKAISVFLVLFAGSVAFMDWRHRQSTEILTRSFDAKLAALAGERSKHVPTTSKEMDPLAQRRKAERTIARIQGIMDAERRDSGWAIDVESWISTTYGASASSGSRIEKVECKETLCMVEAVHENEDTFRQWSIRFNGYPKGLPQMMMLPTTLPDGKTRTKAFLLKEGYEFPPQET